MNDPAQARSRRAVARLDAYPHRVTDSIRLGDLDPQAHVNNAVFATYFETGRVYFLQEILGGLFGGDVDYVLARLEIDYLRELHWPGPVEIGTRVARVGSSSLTLDQAVFKQDVCAASGLTVMVRLDKQTRRAAPFPAAMAAELKAMIA